MIEEKEGGYLANLTPEELDALEEKKAKLAAALLAKREAAERTKIEAAKTSQKAVWKKKRMYVKGHKVCEANRIFEEDGWYVCEVCSKRFNDIDWIEEHVKTTKHLNNMDWYATRPLPTNTDESSTIDNENGLPPYIEFSEDWYLCTLCNAKAASPVILDAHLNGKEHQKRLTSQDWYAKSPGEFVLPEYCEFNSTCDLPYVCKWCNKKAACVDLLLSHLEGKEHAKKAGNIGLPNYGEPGHLEAAAAYTRKYGFDVWARQDHWPAWMLDDGQTWKCEECKKKFITPSAVNEHINDHKGSKAVRTVKASSVVRNTAKAVVKKLDELVENSQSLFSSRPDYTCHLCLLPFGSLAELSNHESRDPNHILLLQKVNSNFKAAPQMDLMDI